MRSLSLLHRDQYLFKAMVQDYRLRLLICSAVVSLAVFTVIFARKWTFDEWGSHTQNAQQTGATALHRQSSQVQWQSTPFNDIELQPSSIEVILFPLVTSTHTIIFPSEYFFFIDMSVFYFTDHLLFFTHYHYYIKQNK